MRPVLSAFAAMLFLAQSAVAAPPKNQEAWLFGAITNDIAQMLLYAAAKKNGHTFDPDKMECQADQNDQSQQIYSVSIKSPELPGEFKREIKLEKCIYETPSYAKFAADLIAELKLTPDDGSFVPSADVVKRLSDNSMDALYEQNAAISSALTEHPLNPELQEEAALLYSTFNLLDMSKSFTDHRFGVSRAAAHLAIASAIRNGGAPTFCGKLAETAQFCQSSRDTEATEHAEALFKDASSDAEKSWTRCMYIMATNDPRGFDVDHFTRVEEYQYLKRVAFFESSDKVAEYLQEHHYPTNITWIRLVNNGHVGVDTGHIYTEGYLWAELADWAKDMERWQHKFGSELPVPCLYDGKLQVLSWPDIAFWHQRQLLAGLASTHYFYSQMYGVKETAAQIAAGGKKLFWTLPLYPFVTELLVGNDEPSDFEGALKVMTQSPQVVPGSAWFAMLRGDTTNRFMPISKAWFGDLPLFGTAYDFWGYSDVMKSPQLTLATMTRLRDLAIFNRDVCEKYVHVKYGEHPTGAQWTEGYGKMLEFDRTARWTTVNGDWNDPNKFIPEMTKLAKEDASNYYFTLADYCWFFGRSAETLKYFQIAMATSGNEMYKAADSRWIVDYLFKHGDKKKAEEYANLGAEVYSASGLECRAYLCELEGKLAEAESWYKKEKERYDDDEPLGAFYIRHAAIPTYSARAKAAVLKFFGKDGLVKVEAITAKAKPSTGVRVEDVLEKGQHMGLKEGDRIVAFNGYRVRNLKEFAMIKEIDRSFYSRGVFWDGHKYKSYRVPIAFQGYATVSDRP